MGLDVNQRRYQVDIGDRGGMHDILSLSNMGSNILPCGKPGRNGDTRQEYALASVLMLWHRCFLHYWPFVRGIQWWSLDSPNKGAVMYDFHVFWTKYHTDSYVAHALRHWNGNVWFPGKCLNSVYPVSLHIDQSELRKQRAELSTFRPGESSHNEYISTLSIRHNQYCYDVLTLCIHY